jgi:hypothetical protein
MRNIDDPRESLRWRLMPSLNKRFRLIKGTIMGKRRPIVVKERITSAAKVMGGALMT